MKASSGRDVIRLSAGDASAEIALVGAEPVRWRVGGRDLLWNGDPEHWGYSAPILFPIVGASRGGCVRVDGVEHPMAQHGFAQQLPFRPIACDAASAHLRLTDSEETRAQFPFGFQLDVVATLAPDGLALDVQVANAGGREMPYALGFHPAFVWPLDGPERAGHRVVFAAAERPSVPEIAEGGLLARRSRPVPLNGCVLPLVPELFTEALVFLDARSRGFSFEAPSGASIRMDLAGFPHLAIWSRPAAPFLSLEAWTSHADWEDAAGELSGRASMIRLAPGESRSHRAAMTWRPPA